MSIARARFDGDSRPNGGALRRCARRARAVWTLIALFAVCATVVAVLALSGRAPRHAVSSAASDAVVPEDPPAATQRVLEAAPRADVERSATIVAPEKSQTPTRPARTGVIRGKVIPAPGVAMPRAWTLSIRASAIVTGAEPADVRSLVFENGEDTFRVDDLPLGGYSVRALAPGLNPVPVDVLLTVGAANPFVTLGLAPSGSIAGALLEQDGAPAEGVTVTLETRGTKARRMLDSDAAGAFRFVDVLDGEYTLYVGRPEAPLVPPKSLSFRAPQMTLAPQTLKPTGRARVTTRDEDGRAVAGVFLTGFASPEGVIEVKSDELGVALVHHLPPGRYRLHARTDDGRKGAAVLEIVAGAEAQTDVRLRRD